MHLTPPHADRRVLVVEIRPAGQTSARPVRLHSPGDVTRVLPSASSKPKMRVPAQLTQPLCESKIPQIHPSPLLVQTVRTRLPARHPRSDAPARWRAANPDAVTAMAPPDDDAHVPWGKYTYALEGLASRCYLEGAAAAAPRPGAPPGRRLRFRVELPARCFVLSVAVKLPHAAPSLLPALQDVAIERTLSGADYETVYDGYIANNLGPPSADAAELSSDRDSLEREDPVVSVKMDDAHAESPTAVDATADAEKPDAPLPRKKVMEVRRAADSLRLTITDMDEERAALRRRRSAASDSDDASDSGDLRTLGIVVVGYVRGQTPASNRIKILLNSSARLGLHSAVADRAEVDGLLGLAFLGNRRYRQAAELLQRASELTVQVASADAKAGCAIDDALAWAAELNLLAAHAYFEHMPMSNDGIVRLVQVAATAKVEGKENVVLSRDVREMETDFLDLRTELLSMLEGLLTVLIKFLGESNSLAVKMASSRMIEFISEQLGCAIARHMAALLDQVLRLYPTCTSFGARERAAAASFSYDSMEDCYERLIDICCRLFPLTEHSVLRDLFDETLIPVFMDVFQESDYLCYDADAEEMGDELISTAVAQAMRVICLVLSILGVDASVPTSLTRRVLNILIPRNGSPRTPLLLRRTALHTWDAISRALKHSAFGNPVGSFGHHIRTLTDFIPELLVDSARQDFEYGDIEEENEAELEIFKQGDLVPQNSQVLQELLAKRSRRIEIADRHTLGRVLSLTCEICNALEPNEEDEEGLSILISLQEMLGAAIANLLMSSLIDVSYHEAVVSGNGPQESNSMYEFGDIRTQLKIVCEVMDELFTSYWAALSLLPEAKATQCVKIAPIRAVLGWCVDRMGHSAPPKGMLKLLHAGVRGLQHELNTPMYKLPAVPASPHEVTFISIHRAHLHWLPQSVHEEAFDLMDILNEAVAEDLMARDLSLLIQGLGDQAEKFQNRTEASLELLASIVATSMPKRSDLAVSSLRALVDPSLGTQRISNGFPKSNRSNTGSFTRRLQFSSSTPKADPMAQSLYIHVVLASCFDSFDSLGKAAKRRGGPSYMGEKIDAFVEHAALAVRCLHSCARARRHREYVGAVLGDIFGTCLAMQDHGDGRVRLAGFEIFAASLDVLFLAQKAMILVPSQPNNSTSEASVLGAGAVPPATVGVSENVNGVTELTPSGEKDLSSSVSTVPPVERTDSGALVTQGSAHKSGEDKQVEGAPVEDDGMEEKLERRMLEIYADGGSCTFQSEEAPPSRLAFEERAWQMLCAFITSSLGIGKYVDFVVQRACLEYLKGCMLNALRGRSTGASVITFEHIALLWDAVNRLVGSPWRTLNALALWVICALMNVAIYSSIMAKGRGAARQKTAQLNEFVLNQVFPRAEELLKTGIRETRVWGMLLLEAYIRARDLNNHVVHVVPPPPGRLLRCLDNLKHDWDDDVRERSQSLLEIHFNSINKKLNSVQTFTAHATTFMSMKRHHDDGFDGADSSKIDLWFPPLPKQMLVGQMEMYCRTLEGFANAEVTGGEETDLVGAAEENEGEDEYNGPYEDDDEGYEFEDEHEEVGDLVEDDSENALEAPEDDDTVRVPDGDEEDVLKTSDSDDFGDSEGEEETATESPDPDTGEIPKQEPMKSDEETVHVQEDVSGREESVSLSAGVGDSPVVDEIEDDDEFSHEGNESAKIEAGPVLLTQVSENEDDEFDAVAIRVASSDEDVDDEDEVVNVTDEEDVLVDVDSVRQAKESPHGGEDGPRRTTINSPLKDETPSGAGSKGDVAGRRSAVSRLSLNPDLDEGVQVLRRKGSFTSRSSATMSPGEGDAPKLARRRSHEVSSVASMFDAGNEANFNRRDDGETSTGAARLRRKSSRSSLLSPRADGNRAKGSPTGAEDIKDTKESSMDKDRSGSIGSRSVRRGAKGVDASGEEPDKARNGEDVSDSQTKKGQLQDAVIGGAFLSLSPKGSRIPRGIRLDDDGEEAFETRPRPGADRNSGSEFGRRGESRSAGSRSNRRSLPRAPAFVKGGGPQRRLSGGLPNLTTGSESKGGSIASGGSGNHSSSPGLSSSSRGGFPRTRGQGIRPPRLESGSPGGDFSEKRPDRSHRYSKREPLNLSFDDEAEEFDKDLLGDLDSTFDVGDDLDNQMRVGTPTAEALKGRNSLADDSPNSGFSKRRGSNRNVFASQHYKGLLDQLETPPPDGSPRSGGSGSSRLDRFSPHSRREFGSGRQSDTDKTHSPEARTETEDDVSS